MVGGDQTLQKRFELLISIPGIAEVSALQLLGELAPLSPELSVRQWVTHSGLDDPAPPGLGDLDPQPSRISRAGNRHLCPALYMPALVAARCDPHMKAFYETLLNRHKAKMQAIVAVARKLLHAIYGVLGTQTPYEGRKLFPALMPM
jgi:transposase